MIPKRLLKHLTADHKSLRDHKYLRCFGALLHRPYLWMINRRTIAMAFAVGLFFAFIPLPFQMVMAAAGAVWLHANLPVSVGLVWLTNPITMPPIFYATYKIGAWVMQIPEVPFHFEASIQWFLLSMQNVLPPFLVGCFVCAVFFSMFGYAVIRIAWRWRVVNKWRMRNNN